ncbi:ZYBA0S15-01002g1_1 [Zygosaccharomyces bailii CLIB 213]|uniref:ZYBA0S15-01002g1_1 n=1 Tax=Zygosaccharomyces bailii (strain CLIB 213 / ATCC 58445 / CBS 680 / BCRC 21525 / NBRC 1098 / NCYC 1416 / NRRL Y-2227) TaxID=1333698 RepID=A0A8J2XAZ4_ZYGB2|nr:ZYBA0S15-01002g1_1 [Zygosaccharomyces bailii CLIB 213]
MHLSAIWLITLLSAVIVHAKTHTFNFTAGWVTANPDGLNEKRMIGFNGEWPVPDIHVNKGDRVEVYLTNGIDEGIDTSLHFHGLFHNTSVGNQNQMDGPTMVTQCPILFGQTYLYNFTVDGQVGTYWYHAHSGAQYGDGMRGAFIIHDENEPFHYDKEMVIQLSDLYRQPYYEVNAAFLSRYNPTGAEPIPQNMLFNNTLNATLDFKPGETYLLRFINSGLFVSHYIALESHELTIVEVDGIYVKPNVTQLLYVATGQRVSVLVKAKETDPGRNFALMQIIDESMLDVTPPELVLNWTHQIAYSRNYPKPKPIDVGNLDDAAEEFYLSPLDGRELYDDYDLQIVLDVRMKNLGDGVKYAFFNNVTYVEPKVPTLTTVLTSGKLSTDPRIYGDNINAYVLGKNEIVEIVLNNYDPGKHPFHLHGHNFQVVQKSPGFHEDENYPEEDQDKMTVPYNESAPLMDFPQHPVVRDTVQLEANGHVVLRFKANNPGVWFFHCHVDWHLTQGLAAVFVEDPETLQAREELGDNYKQICSSCGIKNKGNAAGHSNDWFNLDGLTRQPLPLPGGFTAKGYVAFMACTLAALWGVYTISSYGLSETIQDDKQVFESLRKALNVEDTLT